MKGKFVAFEGITGSGKKTHIKLLVDRLESVGKEVVTLSFPDYESEIARLTKRIDFDPFTLSLLFAADRARHQERIKNFLEKGSIILADRYCYSNFAYQSIKGVSLTWLMEIEKNIIKPDLVILIDVPIDLSIKRIQQSSIEDFTKIEIVERLQKEKETLEKIRKNYLNLAKINKETKWFIIDGSRDIPEIQEEIWSIIVKELKLI